MDLNALEAGGKGGGQDILGVVARYCNCQSIHHIGLALARNSLPVGCKIFLKENTHSFMPLFFLCTDITVVV